MVSWNLLLSSSTTTMEPILVTTGAITGALLRWKINQMNLTPYSTIAINTVGSFILGSSLQLASQNNLSQKNMLLIGTGFCGSFTTFSTFSCDVVTLLDKGLYNRSLSLLLVTNTFGILAAFIGFKSIKYLNIASKTMK